jgi:hypothetical protein
LALVGIGLMIGWWRLRLPGCDECTGCRFGPRTDSAAPSQAERCVDRDHRGSAGVDGVDDLGVVDALQVDRGDPQVRWPMLRGEQPAW